MNAIFLKEVSDSILNGKIAKLNYINISDEEHIMEINISSKFIKNIIKKENDINSKSRNKLKKSSWIDTLKDRFVINKFEKILYKIVNKNGIIGYSVIYSNKIKKNKDIKKFLEDSLNKFSINEYINTSMVEKNLYKYIDEYVAKNSLNQNQIKPLIITKDTLNLNFDIVTEMNNKYKDIDLLLIENSSNNIIDKINRINDEYGSCINLLHRSHKDLRKYNVYIFVDKAKSEYVKYKFNKKACFIDFTNKENDRFNTQYITLEKELKNNKYHASKIKELFELYGKVTVANAVIH